MKSTWERICWALVIAVSCEIVVAQQPTRLDRNNLLQYRDAQGIVRPVMTREQWQIRREEIVRGMQQVMGPLPGDDRRVSLQMMVTETAGRRKLRTLADHVSIGAGFAHAGLSMHSQRRLGGAAKSSGRPVFASHRQGCGAQGGIGTRRKARPPIRGRAGRAWVRDLVSLLPALGELLAQPRRIRLCERNDEGDLG